METFALGPGAAGRSRGVTYLVLRTTVEDVDGRADRMPDDQLLAEVAAGDRAAFGELYRRHAPWLMLRLDRRCPDRGTVEEVVQDVFVAVWRGAARFSGRGEVAAWIWGIARHQLVDALRRRPRPAFHELPDAPAGMSAEDSALEGLQYTAAGVAMTRLAPDLRAVVQATIVDGLTTREAAVVLGIPVGTVKTRMMRARAALREELR
jgi:RNA polymerase sigma-70 factor (ECF subfamily)